MNKMLSQLQTEIAERPRFAPAVTENLLLGRHRLRAAFLQTPLQFARSGMPLPCAGMAEPTILLIRSGFAYCSRTLPGGRRATPRILVSGDYVGLDNIVLTHTTEEIFAADRVSYLRLGTATLRQMLADPCVLMFLLAQIAETGWRADRLAASIGRLDAYARICVLLLDIHDRLRHRGLINLPTFNLPLTQQQIGDHLGLTLVHVNRTLRRLREEKIVIVDRQVVIIRDIAWMRELAQGLPQSAELRSGAVPPEATDIVETLA